MRPSSKSVNPIFDCCDELEDIRFADAMRLLIELLRSIMEAADVHNGTVIDMIVEQFITHLPSAIKEKLAV
ncbi:hypothetical protein AAC03nite_30990 [Alicyclobacillus acidoterrestris]|nr:hypothetical protein AAC03nite_30990 [Alicyclobacillus acidoterrestris]